MPAKKKKAASRGSGKRELITPHEGDSRYVRRDADGKFTESDDVGRSLKQDRSKKAKTTVKSGHGDKGDQKRR
ncbi:MAG: hypothetical protein ABIR71_00650 [Chthoniobacterales bacterium]